MGFDAQSVELMTWKPQLGLTVLIKSPEQLNVPELVRELKKKNMGMIVDITAISEGMCVNLPKIRRILCRVLCSQYILAVIIFGKSKEIRPCCVLSLLHL